MKRAKIQIVEDEAIIAADIEESLASLNYDVVGVAACASEAIEIARNKKPDLVLMDINIEGPMDGIDTAAVIQNDFDIPIVFLTAIGDTPIFNRAKKLEPQAYIMKPFRQVELRTAIDLAIHKHAQERLRKAQGGTPERPDKKLEVVIPDFKASVKMPVVTAPEMQSTICSFLSSTTPFKELPENLLREISRVCYLVSLKNFDVFVHEGRTKSWGFMVVSGRAAVFKRSPGGKELSVELIGPGDLFGVLNILDEGDHPFSARSQGDSRILWIPREVVDFLAKSFPEFNQKVIALVLERLRRAHDFSRALAHDRVEVRIASTLLALQDRFAEKPNTTAELELTRMELAELVGTSPETVSRVFARLVEDDALDISLSGKVRILSPSYLEGVIKCF